MMRKPRVFLAGHTGMVGGALLRQLEGKGYNNLLLCSHAEVDLSDQSATFRLFKEEKPEVVILAAAKVGGILANNSFPAEFIYKNISIQNNVLQAAVETSVSEVLFLGSSCIYPRDCAQPIREEYLMSGPLETTNRPYAVAKIAGVEFCWACNRQYGTRYVAVMPTNIYGLGDNYDLNDAHVVPGLIRRIHEAKESGAEKVVIWGSGSPRREFLYSDDLAEACILLLENLVLFESLIFCEEKAPIVNVGVGHDLEISELAKRICDVVGFEGKLIFDKTKPDGTPRKLLDSSRINGLGWTPKTPLEIGLPIVYDEFLSRRKAGLII